MDTIAQPLLCLEVLLPLQCGVPQCIAHGHRLQPIVRHQDLDEVLSGAEEVWLIKKGTPAVQDYDCWLLLECQQLSEQDFIGTPAFTNGVGDRHSDLVRTL